MQTDFSIKIHQVKDLFSADGEIEGMVSWRLSVQKDGVSRGFGFAEFKTPEGPVSMSNHSDSWWEKEPKEYGIPEKPNGRHI